MLIGIIIATSTGFAVGLLSFEVTSRWYEICGSAPRCPRCACQRSSPQYHAITAGRRPSNIDPIVDAYDSGNTNLAPGGSEHRLTCYDAKRHTRRVVPAG